MGFHIHVDRPTGFLIKNLQQEFTGWLASEDVLGEGTLSFIVDGEEIKPVLYPRDDVEQAFPGKHALGWTFHLDHRAIAGNKRRTLELVVRCGDYEHRRRFYKSKELMPTGNNSPLFFMHIPKTAGTALRQFVDYAFNGFPSLAIYGDYPGIEAEIALDAYWNFTHSRELIFGHYAFDFAQTVHAQNPKVVTIFRDPEEMVRSYQSFNANPNPAFMDNPIVRHVAGVGYTLPFGAISPEHLNAALCIAERNLYVIDDRSLQAFADQVSETFAIPFFEIPRINQNNSTGNGAGGALPFDVRYDMALYKACLSKPVRFTDFLDL